MAPKKFVPEGMSSVAWPGRGKADAVSPPTLPVRPADRERKPGRPGLSAEPHVETDYATRKDLPS